MKSVPFDPGDAVVTANDCFVDFDELSRSFDPFALIDFCSAIDAAVLHERLYTFGHPEGIRNPVLSALMTEGVLVDIRESGLAAATPDKMLNHPASKVPLVLLTLLQKGQLQFTYPKALHGEEDFATVTTWFFAALLATSKDLVIQDQIDAPLIPTASSSVILINHPRVREEQDAFARMQKSLAETYADLKDLLLQERSQLDGHAQLDLPPLAIEVFRRASTADDLGDVVLEVRRKFERLRRYFRDLNETLESPKVPLRAKATEAAKLRRAIQSLSNQEASGPDGVTTLVSFARRANDVAPFEKISKGLALENLSLGKLIVLLLAAAEEAYWKFKLKPLHAIRTRYLDLSSKDIRDSVKKHFNYEVSGRDRGKVTGYRQLAESTKRLFSEVEFSITMPPERGPDDQSA